MEKSYGHNMLCMEEIAEAIADMTDEERLALFSRYCMNCGSSDPNCQCWNDD